MLFRHRLASSNTPAEPPTQTLGFNARILIGIVTAMMTVIAMPLGCGPTVREAPPATPPAATFTGPPFLHGTIGSMVSLRGFTPMLVSGYGMVWSLDDTGSSEVPPFLKQWLIKELRMKGFGSTKSGLAELKPDRLLSDPSTTVVRIEGLIPPGAVKGTRFDLLVTAIDTQTTSLQNGSLLMSWNLAQNGANQAGFYSTPLARAKGDLYVDPSTESENDDSLEPLEPNIEQRPQAVVIAGGLATQERLLELVLNQPSWMRSRAIADRINEIFPRQPMDKFNIAEAKTDQLIQLHVPHRYAQDTDMLLRLIAKLYIQRSDGFEPQKARELLTVLESQPDLSLEIGDACQALGKKALPVLRKYYEHSQVHVRLAAMRAGAMMGDELASLALIQDTTHADSTVRRQCAETLAHLPNSLKGNAALESLLNDQDRAVRIAAYESLAHFQHVLVKRMLFTDENNGLKFALDLVPSDKPMVYLAQKGTPRVVIFGPNVMLKSPSVGRIWHNRLMLKVEASDKAMQVFHQPMHQTEGKTYQAAPLLANLVFLLAHRPDEKNRTPGLNLSYTKVVSAVHRLHKAGLIEAELEVQANPLVQAIEKANSEESLQRPETPSSPTSAPASSSSVSLPPTPAATDPTNDPTKSGLPATGQNNSAMPSGDQGGTLWETPVLTPDENEPSRRPVLPNRSSDR